MAHAHSTFNVNISRCLRITHAIILTLSHALYVTVFLYQAPSALYVRVNTSVTYHVELLYSVNGVCFLCKDLYEPCPLSDLRNTSGNGCDSLRHWWTGTCDLYQPQSELRCTLLCGKEKRFLKPL